MSAGMDRLARVAVRVVGLVVVVTAGAGPIAAALASPSPAARNTTVPPGPLQQLQTAAGLLDNAGYAAAAGEPVAGPEDDGGFQPGDGSQQTTARVLGASGLRYTVQLDTYPDLAAAQDAYAQLVQRASSDTTSEPIAGLGDQAVYASGTAVVQRGAQVLVVTVEVTGAAETTLETIKETGGDPTAQFIADNRAVIPVAQAVGAKLDGRAVVTPVDVLPANGVDPCAGEPELAAQVLDPATQVLGVTLSERPPATECRLATPANGVQLFVVTDEQLAASIAPTTVADLYAADLAAAQANGGATVTGRVLTAGFSTTAPEVMAETLGTGPSGRQYLVTALVPGSFGSPGSEAAFAAALAALVAAVPAAIEAPPPPPPTTVPVTTTTVPAATTTAAVSSTIAAATTTIAASPPTTRPPATPIAGPASPGSSSSNTGTVIVVVALVLVGGIATALLDRRRRSRLVAGPMPRTEGVPGPAQSRISEIEGSWNIGVAAVPGATTHHIAEEEHE